MDSNSFVTQYRAELRRIGLDEHTSPYGGMASGNDEAVAEFLSHLKALPVGATWRDVYPDIPKHWDLDDDETWTRPYRPLGAFDYPTLPCGPALVIHLPLAATDDDLRRLADAAAEDGFKIYGSAFIYIQNPDWPDRLADVVLDVATTESQYHEFGEWIRQRAGVDVAVFSRPVDTQYASEDPDDPSSHS